LGVVVGINFVDRNWNLLAAPAGERDVDVAFYINSRIADRVQIVGNRLGDLYVATVARVTVALDNHWSGMRAKRYPRNHKVFGADYDGGIHAGKADFRARQAWRLQGFAYDLDLATRQRRRWIDCFDIGVPIHVFSAQDCVGDTHEICRLP